MFYEKPEGMTPEERVNEICAILAAGYLRMRILHEKTPKKNGQNSM